MVSCTSRHLLKQTAAEFNAERDNTNTPQYDAFAQYVQLLPGLRSDGCRPIVGDMTSKSAFLSISIQPV
ncbi:hypothetical protein TNCV_4748011 [Trichonephila clavipes]|nr:hypothetical protein TNCV_4748011 [Trichonephila clavipes]